VNPADYSALIAFSSFEALEALLYIALRWSPVSVQHRVDYRFIFTVERCIGWFPTMWLVYAVLIAILKQLPGILRFSLRFLNATCGIALILAFVTVRPEYVAAMAAAHGQGDWKVRMTYLCFVLERAISFAALLAIFTTLVFVLFFPFRVPRNLAVISTALCLMLSLQISLLLLGSYLPSASRSILGGADEILLLGCLAYWGFAIDVQGQVARVTLGRGWHTVPKDHLVRQLEAINAALLSSREGA
jgi:uncharacterized protein YhhL (DUF1145 family)